ncbi:mevalonate kinase [Streptomyces glaucescens]
MMTSTDPRTFADRGGAAADPGAAPARTGAGRAHGKAILLGEHAVVYGAPALAIPVPQLTATASATRCRRAEEGEDDVSFALTGPDFASVTPVATDGLRRLVAEFKARTGVTGRMCVDVLIDCAIPQGRGLGSSAACARAAALALADLLGRPLDAGAVYDLVQASENVAHGRASGIDAVATGSASPLLFRSGSARELPLRMRGNRLAERPDGHVGVSRSYGFDGLFVIADSGVGGSTKDAVELLRQRFEQEPETRTEFISRVSDLTHAAASDLAEGRPGDFGARMTENHELLRELGLSTDRIEALAGAALAAGGLGAKISGGGLGGCMIALAGAPRQAEEVVESLHAAGAARTWLVPVGRFAGHAD